MNTINHNNIRLGTTERRCMRCGGQSDSRYEYEFFCTELDLLQMLKNWSYFEDLPVEKGSFRHKDYEHKRRNTASEPTDLV